MASPPEREYDPLSPIRSFAVTVDVTVLAIRDDALPVLPIEGTAIQGALPRPGGLVQPGGAL